MHDPDDDLLVALQAGDEGAFATLLERHSGPMLRLSRHFVADREAAEDAIQDTWEAVVRGIHRFERRSAFRTWLYRILINHARTRGVRDARTIAFSVLALRELAANEVVVDPSQWSDELPGWLGHWAADPRPWAVSPEKLVLEGEIQSHLRVAIEALPPVQRTVLALRDVEGWSAREVAELLELSEGNQRVILHRARARVRRTLAEYLDER